MTQGATPSAQAPRDRVAGALRHAVALFARAARCAIPVYGAS